MSSLHGLWQHDDATCYFPHSNLFKDVIVIKYMMFTVLIHKLPEGREKEEENCRKRALPGS